MKKHYQIHLLAIIVLSTLSLSCNIDRSQINSDKIADLFSSKIIKIDKEGSVALKGCAADGSLLKIKILKLGTQDLSSVAISVDNLKLGSVSLTTDSKAGLMVEDKKPTAKTEGSVSYYEYIFHAPTVFPTDLAKDSIAISNVKIIINVNDKSFEMNQQIELVRTPIIFAHGLGSNDAAFAPMIEMIRQKKLYIHEALYAPNYAETSTDAYSVNDKVIINAIDDQQEKMSNRGYAISKVNIVGHSMGGILTRLYLQSGTYRNDIDKVITISTPHSGSQGANLLVDLGEKYPETAFGIFATLGAIVDLQVDSKATQDLNGTSLNLIKRPTHVICATFGGVKQIADLIKEKQYFEAILTFGLGTFTGKVYGEDNDIVVPLSSQIGGIKKVANSQYSGQWHCSINISQETADRIVELLEKQSSSINFSSEGFLPPKLVYNSILNDVQVKQVTQTNSSKDTFVMPEDVKDAVIFAIDKNNKIINAQYCTTELKYTNAIKDVTMLYVIAHAKNTDDILCSSIVIK